MNQEGVFETLRKYAVIPVIAIDDAESAIPLADALLSGGLPIAEITFRTSSAGEVIARLKRDRPQLMLGAGTILTVDNLRLAKESGAEFGVSPGLNQEVVKEAKRLEMPFIPGVATPTEIETAMGFGLRTLKFFPAEALGGVGMVKALSAPYTHMGVRFMPTGGITINNLEGYLSNPVVSMVGGTWVANREAIAATDWNGIRENCEQACEAVARIREKAAEKT